MKHDKYIYLFCSRYGAPKVRANLKRLRESKKCNCGFRISLMLKDEKYVIHESLTKPIHNHELDISVVLDPKAKELIKKKVTNTSRGGDEIQEMVNTDCGKSFKYDTVYNEIRKARAELFGKPGDDAYLLVNILKQLKQKHNFEFRHKQMTQGNFSQ